MASAGFCWIYWEGCSRSRKINPNRDPSIMLMHNVSFPRWTSEKSHSSSTETWKKAASCTDKLGRQKYTRYTSECNNGKKAKERPAGCRIGIKKAAINSGLYSSSRPLWCMARWKSSPSIMLFGMRDRNLSMPKKQLDTSGRVQRYSIAKNRSGVRCGYFVTRVVCTQGQCIYC